MKKTTILVIVLITVIGLTVKAQDGPSESQIASIQKVLKAKYADVPENDRRFIVNAIDLNDDGKDEYLVGLTGTYFCGRAGCTMLILSNTFKTINTVTLVDWPVYVGAPGGNESTKGYSNLYLYTGGKGFVKLAWNGAKYPSNPSMAPSIPESVIKEKFKFLNGDQQSSYDW